MNEVEWVKEKWNKMKMEKNKKEKMWYEKDEINFLGSAVRNLLWSKIRSDDFHYHTISQIHNL
jgi:hypothetical protein